MLIINDQITSIWNDNLWHPWQTLHTIRVHICLERTLFCVNRLVFLSNITRIQYDFDQQCGWCVSLFHSERLQHCWLLHYLFSLFSASRLLISPMQLKQIMLWRRSRSPALDIHPSIDLYAPSLLLPRLRNRPTDAPPFPCITGSILAPSKSINFSMSILRRRWVEISPVYKYSCIFHSHHIFTDFSPYIFSIHIFRYTLFSY